MTQKNSISKQAEILSKLKGEGGKFKKEAHSHGIQITHLAKNHKKACIVFIICVSMKPVKLCSL